MVIKVEKEEFWFFLSTASSECSSSRIGEVATWGGGEQAKQLEVPPLHQPASHFFFSNGDFEEV